MANRRKLKKQINAISSELFAEGVAASLYVVDKNKESVDEVLKSILLVHDDIIRRISHKEPGISAKAYFDNCKKDFNKHVTEMVDHICSLS